jgi:RHS repeat-associated protein
VVGMKHFEQTDHWGNCASPYASPKRRIRDSHPVRNATGVMVVHSDKRIAVTDGQGQVLSYRAEVLSITDYYPFGMALAERTVTTAEGYRYGFNGKEDDDEWGIQDYGFRLYNPSIAKFISVDPLIKDYPWYTPYQFAGNKPIWAVDLDGLEEFIRTQWFVIGETGATLWKTEIQVVKSDNIHTGVQLVHQNVNIVDQDGNVSTRYIGTTVGTRNPTNVANGSTGFSASENAAIWNSVPVSSGSSSVYVTFPNQSTGNIETRVEQPIPGGMGTQISVQNWPMQPQGMVVINQPGVAGPANMAPVPTGLHNTPADPAQRINITDPGAPLPSLQTGAPLKNGKNAGKMLVNTNDMNKPTLRPVGTGQQKTMNSSTPGKPLILRDRRGLSLTIF